VYSGNTAYGLHQAHTTFCTSLYQPIRTAENLLNVDVVFDRAATPGAVRFRHAKNDLSLRKYNFYRPSGALCHYRVRYGDFASVAYAQVRLYGGGPCRGTGVELFGNDFATGPWKKSGEITGQTDACGPYTEIQATSPAGNTAAGMAVVTPDSNRIFYSHTYTDRPFNNDGPTCP
jgi:hypothetical protein